MPRIEVIPHKKWQHVSGRTASVYGSVPWTSSSDRENWELVEKGFTWYDNKNNTVGLCRVPVETIEEAQAFADEFNIKFGQA